MPETKKKKTISGSASAVKSSLASSSKKTVSKKETSVVAKKTTAKKSAKKLSSYFEAVGRRKTSTARVRLFSGKGGITVNDQKLEKYFPTKELQNVVHEPLNAMKVIEKFETTVKIKGGGIHSQAEALRHGISRALIKFNPEFRKRLKKAGFLARDPRMKERRKFGLKKARKASQWSKR